MQNEFGVAPPEERPAGGGGGGGGRGGLAAGTGVMAEPGTYTVAIAMGDKTDSTKVTVEQDPRLQVPTGDRDKRRQTIDTLISLAREADASRKKAVAIFASLTSLTASWSQPGAPAVPDAVKKSADELLARAKTVSARFQAAGGGGRGGGGGAGGGAPFVPPPITQKIGRLISVIDNYSGAPTAFQLTEMQDCAAQLPKDVEELNKLAAEVPKLNKTMSDAGVLYINPGNP